MMAPSLWRGAAHRRPRQPLGLPVAAITLGAITNVEAVQRVHLPTFGPLAGLLLLFVIPSVVFADLLSARPTLERFLIAEALTIGSLEALGLVIDLVLPLLGVQRPLARTPLLIAVDCLMVALLVVWVRHQRVGVVSRRTRARQRQRATTRIALALAPLSTVLGAVGAVRINNGLGDLVSLIALGLVCIAAGVMLWRAQDMSPVDAGLAVACLGATVLLVIAMRGWFVSGPDSLGEYANYLRVASSARWTAGSGSTAYNACLSITILPTLLTAVTHVSGVWVWKVIFPLLFAPTPAAVYAISSRFTTRRVSVLAALIFISFPTFVYSLTFAARQEVAFVFVGAAIIVMLSEVRQHRASLLSCLGVGMILSHYSTSYFFAASMLLSVIAALVLRLGIGRLGRGLTMERMPAFLLPLPLLAIFIVSLVLWEGPVNGVLSDVSKIAQSAADEVTGRGSSGTILPAQVGGVRVVPSDGALASYAAIEEYVALHGRTGAPGVVPDSLLRQYTATQESVLDMPFTTLGHDLDDIGLSPTAVNGRMRELIADGLEALVGIGLILMVFRRRCRNLELVAIGASNALLIGVIAGVPALISGYGPARAFQQGLFVLAPAVAIGFVELLRLLRVPARNAAVGGVAVVSMASLVGFLPQVTGGYVAQIDLDNRGTFIADYFTTNEEIAAARWVDKQPVAVLQMNPYETDKLIAFVSVPITNANFPNDIRYNSTMLFGTQEVVTGDEVASGQLFYRYPTALLQRVKSKIYASEGASIYR